MGSGHTSPSARWFCDTTARRENKFIQLVAVHRPSLAPYAFTCPWFNNSNLLNAFLKHVKILESTLMCVVFHVMLKWNKKPRNRAQSNFTNATIQQRWFFTTGVCTLFTIGETLFRRLKPKAALRQHKHSEPTCFRPNRTPRRSKRRKVALSVSKQHEHRAMVMFHYTRFAQTPNLFSSLAATFLRRLTHSFIASRALSTRRLIFLPLDRDSLRKMRVSANNIVWILINYSQHARCVKEPRQSTSPSHLLKHPKNLSNGLGIGNLIR